MDQDKTYHKTSSFASIHKSDKRCMGSFFSKGNNDETTFASLLKYIAWQMSVRVQVFCGKRSLICLVFPAQNSFTSHLKSSSSNVAPLDPAPSCLGWDLVGLRDARVSPQRAQRETIDLWSQRPLYSLLLYCVMTSKKARQQVETW